MKKYERVLMDGGPMSVCIAPNKDFPGTSARPYSILVRNPRNGMSFEVDLPETCKKGTIGYAIRKSRKAEAQNDY